MRWVQTVSQLSLKVLVCLWLVAGLTYGTQVGAADITFECQDDLCYVTLKGEIVGGDADRFAEAISEINGKQKIVRQVRLLSPGGSVSEGISIGRIVRDNLIFVVAPVFELYIGFDTSGMSDEDVRARCETQCIQYLTDSSTYASTSSREAVNLGAVSFLTNKPVTYDPDIMCASSCALIAMAGVERSGIIGLHHIYSKQTSSDYEELNRLLDSASDEIDDYLRYVRAPNDVITRIFSTPSNDVSWIDLKDNFGHDRIFYEYIIDGCTPLTNTEEQEKYQLSNLKEHGSYVDLDTIEIITRSISPAEIAYLNQLEDRQRCVTERKLKAQRQAQFAE